MRYQNIYLNATLPGVNKGLKATITLTFKVFQRRSVIMYLVSGS